MDEDDRQCTMSIKLDDGDERINRVDRGSGSGTGAVGGMVVRLCAESGDVWDYDDVGNKRRIQRELL